MELLAIFLAIMLIIYNYLMFRFADGLLKLPRFKKAWRIPFVILNIFLAVIVTNTKEATDTLSYIFFYAVIFIGLLIYFKDKFLNVFFIASAFILHIMAVRSVCVAVFAWTTGFSIFEIVHDEFYVLLSMLITFAILNAFIFAVLKIFTSKNLQVIMERSELVALLGIWTTVFNLYLIFNSKVYDTNQSGSAINENHFFMPLAILIGLYVVLLFAVRASSLTGYKEKSEELEQEVIKEKQYRDSLSSGAIFSYEVNLTKNRLISGLEGLRSKFDINTDIYNEILNNMAEGIIFSEDMRQFLTVTSTSYLLSEFEQGKRETIAEYRLKIARESKEYKWVRAVTSIVRDADTLNIKAFIYIKDIDDEKKKQLELQYKAERDSLTGLYNKGMTGKLIAEHIAFNQRNAKGALFIIDVDNFKAINDNFGHTYGDAVLCELAERLMLAFRGDDIVGRIGGDEFIVFMKNVTQRKKVVEKAKEICSLFINSYTSENEKEHIISASIGIAMYPLDGNDFEALYKNSDTALYHAKNQGKNMFSFYEVDFSFDGYDGKRTEIDKLEGSIQKTFKNNRIEYVFKMLYDAKNPTTAIHNVLELVTKHFNFDRGYIFETSADEKYTNNTYEICAEGIVPQIETLQNVPIASVNTANANFHKSGTFVARSIYDLPENEKAVLEPQGIKSMFQFGIFDGEKLLGFIGFDNCKIEGSPTDEDINELAIICNVLSTFFVKNSTSKTAQRNLEMFSSAMNHLDSIVYIVDAATREIMFYNDKAKEVTGLLENEKRCHKFFRGNDCVCKDCPINDLSSDTHQKCENDIYNEKLDTWYKVTASRLDWGDNKDVCFVNCVDISSYKNPFKNSEI